MQIFHSASIDARNGEFHIPFNGEFMPDNEQIMPSEILVSIDICLPSSVVVNFLLFNYLLQNFLIKWKQTWQGT